MGTNYSVDAYGPGPGTAVSVSGTGSTPVELTGKRYAFIATAKTNIVFVASTAGTVAAATDLWMPADTVYVFDVIPSLRFVSFFSAATGTLVYTKLG